MLLYLQTRHKQFIDRHAYCANLDKCPSFLPTNQTSPWSVCCFKFCSFYCWCLQCIQSHFSCIRLCNSMDCSPPGSSVCEILQARTLEWVTIYFSRGSFQPRDWTWVSRIAGRFFTVWATRKAQGSLVGCNSLGLKESDTTKQLTHCHTHCICNQ